MEIHERKIVTVKLSLSLEYVAYVDMVRNEREKKHERGQLWCDKIQHESGKVRKIWK